MRVKVSVAIDAKTLKADLNEEMEGVLGYVGPASYSRPAFPERRPSPIKTNGAQ